MFTLLSRRRAGLQTAPRRRSRAFRKRAHVRAALCCAVAAVISSLSAAASDESFEGSSALKPPPADSGALRYDTDYPSIGYSEQPKDNPIARLQERLDRGEIKLKYHRTRGYLDSLLQALGIDPRSQTLVYSKTSLQLELIRAETPRAIYFNENTYVAWIPHTPFIEIATMDARMGPVFYTLPNDRGARTEFNRETLRCLNCHDTFALAGGGVPRFLFLSTLVSRKGEALTNSPGMETTDQTPIRDRWGGWYVTGQHGDQVHLGNILVDRPAQIENLDSVRRGNLDSLSGLFNTKPYITDKSDIVALLVFDHQVYVHNLITRANYKSRTLLERLAGDASGEMPWAALPARAQRAMKAMLEPLVRALLFAGAVELTSPIRSSSGFDEWFQAQGPRDPSGRSLRELDLTTRLFKRRLSYLVYSEGFDHLPLSAREYVLTRLADILSGRDNGTEYAYLPAAERKELLEILSATKPAFARVAEARAAECAREACTQEIATHASLK